MMYSGSPISKVLKNSFLKFLGEKAGNGLNSLQKSGDNLVFIEHVKYRAEA